MDAVEFQHEMKSAKDFGYTKYRDREEDLSRLTFEVKHETSQLGLGGANESTCVIEAWTPDRQQSLYSPNKLPVGYIEIGPSGRGGYYVWDVNIEREWRGTGLGQMLYDRAIEEAKKLGATRLWSSDDMQPDAHRAWSRLSQRYPVKRFRGRYFIELNKNKTAAEGQAVWTRVQEDFLAGIVYHGTTVEIAEIILKTGFRGLEWDEILDDVLAKWGKTRADIPKRMVKILEGTRQSYSYEHHLVSTSPGGGVACRWAGIGGEVPLQIEAYVLNKYRPRDVAKSRMKGDPAVIKCRIKSFESTPHYERVKKWVDGMSRLIADGGIAGDYTPEEAAKYLWNDYANFTCKPEELEVLDVLVGAEVTELAQHPLGVSIG